MRWSKVDKWRNKTYTQKLVRSKAKAWLDALKASACQDCGGSFPPEAMDFDHCRGAKLFAISQGFMRARDEIRAEIAKCDLVCSNCHRIRTKHRIKDGVPPSHN